MPQIIDKGFCSLTTSLHYEQEAKDFKNDQNTLQHWDLNSSCECLHSIPLLRVSKEEQSSALADTLQDPTISQQKGAKSMRNAKMKLERLLNNRFRLILISSIVVTIGLCLGSIVGMLLEKLLSRSGRFENLGNARICFWEF